MKGNEFPFSQLGDSLDDPSKMIVKKRIHYRNSNEYTLIREKIDTLKTLSLPQELHKPAQSG